MAIPSSLLYIGIITHCMPPRQYADKKKGDLFMARDLTQGRPFSVLLRFALPVIGGNLFQLFYTLADSVIVGRMLGADALAAVGSTSVVVYLVLCFIQGLSGGFGICMGQRFGAGDERAVQRSATVSWQLTVLFSVALTIPGCLLTRPILGWMQTPAAIRPDAYAYLFVILAGTGATFFYNTISNLLRALGDSRTPLIFLVVSSLGNIALDILFIGPLDLGVAGAAWATVLSQLIAAVLSTIVGIRRYAALRGCRIEKTRHLPEIGAHLRIGFPMGFQRSVMCIGQLAMQAAVNALGASAIAGYTAATKVDQFSVLINGAFGIAVAGYVAQNYGARAYGRIRSGVRASLIQIECANLLMAALMLLCRRQMVSLFIDNPTEAIIGYATGYFAAVAPFYPLLGLLQVYRSAEQSMDDSRSPFAACIIELVMRLCGTAGLARVMGYTGVCLASPLAWLGAIALLIPVYYRRTLHFGRETSGGKTDQIAA